MCQLEVAEAGTQKNNGNTDKVKQSLKDLVNKVAYHVNRYY
ncbi:hypothetical protein AOR13_1097 [Alteromonas stellipolaris LMG 21856]|nr:hypothetical protein AOR13_1097 [Alteromonas stellipolaris LMG 21856]